MEYTSHLSTTTNWIFFFCGAINVIYKLRQTISTNKNFYIEKRRKTRSISPIPYAFLCSVLESVKHSRKTKITDATSFMVARYLTVGCSGSKIVTIRLRVSYTLHNQCLLTSNPLLVYPLHYFLRVRMAWFANN